MPGALYPVSHKITVFHRCGFYAFRSQTRDTFLLRFFLLENQGKTLYHISAQMFQFNQKLKVHFQLEPLIFK